jgi:hypothetical protein
MGGMTSFRSRAKRRMAAAIKCSESASSAAASAKARSSKVPAIRWSRHIHHAELTLRERAGFIEDDHIDLARGFERKAIADEDAVARAQRGGDGNDERNRKTQRMRTGNDKNCDDAREDFEIERVGNRPGDAVTSAAARAM